MSLFRGFVVLCLVSLAACSSGGDLYDGAPGNNASAQCVMACQQYRNACLARSDSDRRSTCDAQAASKCDRIKDDEMRRSCMSQAQACMDQSPLIGCSQDADSCMASCGGG